MYCKALNNFYSADQNVKLVIFPAYQNEITSITLCLFFATAYGMPSTWLNSYCLWYQIFPTSLFYSELSIICISKVFKLTKAGPQIIKQFLESITTLILCLFCCLFDFSYPTVFETPMWF